MEQMGVPEEWIMEVMERTHIVRLPRSKLSTFGVTNLQYYLVTEPAYQGVVKSEPEGVIRDGRVIAERPIIVTPTYMLNLEGFGTNARSYMQHLMQRYGPQSPGLLYTYKNEPKDTSIVGGDPIAIARRISDDLNQKGDNNSLVIVGVDALWDVSLIKAVYEVTAASLTGNVEELDAMGLLDPDPNLGVPRDAVQRIEALFRDVERGGFPDLLKRELDRWSLFGRYEDRFLSLFQRRRR